jgi:hypothetical protein
VVRALLAREALKACPLLEGGLTYRPGLDRRQHSLSDTAAESFLADQRVDHAHDLSTLLVHRGMDLYFKRHDGQAVTCDDFVQAMADASGVAV